MIKDSRRKKSTTRIKEQEGSKRQDSRRKTKKIKKKN